MSKHQGTTGTVAEAVRQRYSELTDAQRQMAEYVLAQADDVAFMAAKQLGEATASSDAAVIRFAQALGFRGFLELRVTLREELLQRAGSIGVATRAGVAETVPSVAAEVFQLDRVLLAQTESLNDSALYGSVAEALVAARQVWVIGHGTSYPMAAYLAMMLNQALPHARALSIATGDLAGELRDLGPQDAVIGIGYVRYLPYTIDLMRLAKQRRARLFAITDKATSPLARLADIALFAARDGVAFAVSQIGSMAIAHVLLTEVARRAPDVLREQLRLSDQLWQDVGHWSRQHAPADAALRRAPSRRKSKLPDGTAR
jgi:DNA-binding MurR/RpiR family transcriptional regulator